MRIKIVSNFRSDCDTTITVTDEVVPSVGDEVIWLIENGGGRMRGIVKKRTIDYSIPPEVITRTHRYDVTLQMQDAEPVFNVP
jgi:hypothetical protein